MMHRSAIRLAIASAVLATGILTAVPRAQVEPCPVARDPAALADAPALEKMNAFVDRLGVRPTGSRAHVRYIDWVRRQLEEIPGVTLRDVVLFGTVELPRLLRQRFDVGYEVETFAGRA